MCPQTGLCQHAEPGQTGWGRGRSYLIRHHDERVFVFGEKVEETPELEGVLVGHNTVPVPVRLVILLGRQGPAELVKAFFDKSTFLHLRVSTEPRCPRCQDVPGTGPRYQQDVPDGRDDPAGPLRCLGMAARPWRLSRRLPGFGSPAEPPGQRTQHLVLSQPPPQRLCGFGSLSLSRLPREVLAHGQVEAGMTPPSASAPLPGTVTCFLRRLWRGCGEL